VLLELKHLVDFSLKKVTTNINAQNFCLKLYLNKSVYNTVHFMYLDGTYRFMLHSTVNQFKV
jgi:hypothetical protein